MCSPLHCVGQNDRMTCGAATASTDVCGSTCTYKQTHGSTSKDSRGSTCTDARGSACTDIYTESTVMHRSMCPYISTEGMGVHEVTSTDDYTVNVAVQVRRNAYDRYGRYETKRDIGTDVVGKVRKGISYADALHKDS